VLDSALRSAAARELLKKVFTSRPKWISLIVEWNASANMFYLLKYLLSLILVIFKLKCNNLIFNEIMILNASYVFACIFASSRITWSRFWKTDFSFLRWFCHNGVLAHTVYLKKFLQLCLYPVAVSWCEQHDGFNYSTRKRSSFAFQRKHSLYWLNVFSYLF
jgi:hypothetical protein